MQQKNLAFIDGANLHRGVSELGWKLDYKKFRIWLTEKYSVKRAYLFIGLIPKYKDIYNSLQESGFTLIFKETVQDSSGAVKGNCDADLVLWAVRGSYEKEFDRAVIVSGDGDYASLVRFLQEKQNFPVVLSPNKWCSILIKRTGVPISYLSDQRLLLEELKNEKTPDRDETL